MDPPFKTGDKVRLKTGNSPIIVQEVDWFEQGPRWAKKNWGARQVPRSQWYIRFAYASSLHYDDARKWREATDFVFYDEQPEEKETIMTKPSLYQTKEDKPRYGTFLIKNSAGQMVLEMKGEGGVVESFDEAAIEVVTPHC